MNISEGFTERNGLVSVTAIHWIEGIPIRSIWSTDFRCLHDQFAYLGKPCNWINHLNEIKIYRNGHYFIKIQKKMHTMWWTQPAFTITSYILQPTMPSLLYSATWHMDLFAELHQSVPLVRPLVSLPEALISNLVHLHLPLKLECMPFNQVRAIMHSLSCIRDI